MSIFQRVLLLFKVLVLLSFGMTAAWAECPDHDEQASSGQVTHSGLMIAASESEPGDQGQGGSAGDDDSTTEDPDADVDENEGA
ncbi:hypothetical protein PS662_01368 [Pseudomonas fluorescens]|uniref:Secreted protein n=1 Tax=Pseudomonas fluorescens TaxID=294 RepID=A0A5E6RAG3_PSEFL|nr:hypothetical protein [Pseudomonas fluorescens]VVM62275.1 hypothetical protein PS662_01368 [Pseudomonas fluorescens]